MGGSITRQTKRSDIRGTRDAVALEAKLASLQLQATQANIFSLFKRINKTYRRAIKRAARKIVTEGKADQYLDPASRSGGHNEDKRKVIEMKELIASGSEGLSGLAQYNGGTFAEADRSECTDVQTIMLQ